MKYADKSGRTTMDIVYILLLMDMKKFLHSYEFLVSISYRAFRDRSLPLLRRNQIGNQRSLKV